MLATPVLKCFVICVVLLKCVSAHIDVIVDANLNKADAFGLDFEIISDKERTAFGIDDYGLKAALSIAFGKRPDDAFVRSPTPWGDLYKTYSWPQVNRTLQPTSAKVLSSSTVSVTLDSKILENNSTLPVQRTAKIFKEETCIVSHTWIKSADLNSAITLDYKINFPVDILDAFMSMTYKNNWGIPKTISQPIRIGSISGVQFMLPSKTKAIVMLVAKKVSMEVEINYAATLQGQVAMNYRLPFKGHHFWGYHINSILSENNKSQTLSSTENLKITYYTTPKIIVKDEKTKNIIVQISTFIDVVSEFLNFQLQ